MSQKVALPAPYKEINDRVKTLERDLKDFRRIEAKIIELVHSNSEVEDYIIIARKTNIADIRRQIEKLSLLKNQIPYLD